MNFADIYRYANKTLTGRNVPFRALAKNVKDYHPRVGDVEIYKCVLNTEISIGYMTYEEERSSPYSEPFDVAIIKFHEDLNRCWQRLVCTKELMHVFDSRVGRANTKEKFIALLGELETAPLYEDSSEMTKSERDAIWMALLVLCPERLRDQYFKSVMTSKELVDVAHILKIPVQAVRAINSSYYQTALETLTGDVT